MIRALVLVLLAACVDSAEPRYRYQCDLVRSCGEVGHFITVPFEGTVDEVQANIDAWVDACQVITEPEVQNQSCSFVLCGAICKPETEI